MSGDRDWLLRAGAALPRPPELLAIGLELEVSGDLPAAATALDLAWGRAPGDAAIAAARMRVLDALAVVEHGILFRYVPAGAFLMGSELGDPDEQPAHWVETDAFWLSETPVTWSMYCDLMGYSPPPEGFPPDVAGLEKAFANEYNKLRLQYCETETVRAADWHASAPEQVWTRGTGEMVTARELFGEVARRDPRRPWEYDQKPMVGVAWEQARALADRLTAAASGVAYQLPTEAQWEKAARGGLAGARYAWGDEPPTPARCDFDRFREFSLLVPRTLPPNGYGLFGMCGGVWEWTGDWYDAEYYAHSPVANPVGPAMGTERVLRGGSWADCASAVTASFRMSLRVRSADGEQQGELMTPTIGFRLCRVARPR